MRATYYCHDCQKKHTVEHRTDGNCPKCGSRRAVLWVMADRVMGIRRRWTF